MADSTAPSSARPRRKSHSEDQPSTNRPGAKKSEIDDGEGSDSAWGDAWADDEPNPRDDNDSSRAFFVDTEDDAGLDPAERRQQQQQQRRSHLLRLDERVIEGGVGDSIAREFAFEGDSRVGLLHDGYAGDSDDDDNNDADGLIGNGRGRSLEAAVTEDERREADKDVLRRLLVSGGLIGLWYLFSLSLSLYNKWMFGQTFPFPLFTTSLHMLVQFLLAFLVLYFIPSLRPGAGASSAPSSSPPGEGSTNNQGRDSEDADKPEPAEATASLGKGSSGMTPWFYLTRIGPCGAATGLDIGLGNASLKLITLTFYTMCKSSSLAFVLLFAFAFRLETPTLRLVAIIATMTVGVVMMVAGEVEFDPLGFFLVISAAFFSGFRWSLTQILLLRNPATSNPFSSIFYLAPAMFVVLFTLAVPMEGFGDLVAGVRTLAAEYGAVRTPLLLVFPGTIAFLMTASEFALLQRTSVVTLSIAGIFKEVVTIGTAMLVYHDRLTLVNVLGLIVTISAIAVYNYVKITRMRRQAQLNVHRGHHHAMHSLSSADATNPSSSSASAPPPPQLHPQRHGDEHEADSENAGLLFEATPSEQAWRGER